MFQSTNDLIQAQEKYGENYYIGIVTDVSDPLGAMRIKARVPGLFDTDLGDVPWIGPLKDSPFGFGPGFGTYGVPQLNSTVVIELQNGDVHKPLYRTLSTAPNANPNFNGANLWGFQDPAGNMVIYNLTTKTYSFVTASGARIDIDGSGNRTTAVKQDTTNTDGAWAVNVTGNASIKASGTIDFEASGTATYKASAHTFIGPVTGTQSIAATTTLSAGGDIIDQTSSGNAKTVANMRQVYDVHDHDYDDGVTSPPNQQI